MRIILLGAPGSGKGPWPRPCARPPASPRSPRETCSGRPSGRRRRSASSPRPRWQGRPRRRRDRPGPPSRAAGPGGLPRRLRLDGFPRNLAQAASLDALGLAGPEIVFDLRVPDEVVLERLTGRRSCPRCEAIYHLVNKPPKTAGVCDVCGRPSSSGPTTRPRSSGSGSRPIMPRPSPWLPATRPRGTSTGSTAPPRPGRSSGKSGGRWTPPWPAGKARERDDDHLQVRDRA